MWYTRSYHLRRRAEKGITVSQTDPESGLFQKGEHKKCFAYEAHTVCDRHNFILGVEVTPGNVHDSVAFDAVNDKVTERFPKVKTVVADAAYRTSQTIDLLVSFFIPIIFSLLYIPVAYAFAVYAKYDTLFMRMSFKEPDDRKIKRNHRIAVLTTCKLSIDQITRFEQEYIPNMYLSMTSMEFDNLIKNFKSNN